MMKRIGNWELGIGNWRKPIDHLSGSQSGAAALVVAMILLVIGFIMALTIMFSQQQEALTTKFYRTVSQDRHFAQTGIDITLQKLNDDPDFAANMGKLAAGDVRNPFDSQPVSGTINFENGQITVKIEPFM